MLRVEGTVSDESGKFQIAIEKAAQAKHRFRVGMAVSGLAVPDPRLETAGHPAYYPLCTFPGRVFRLYSGTTTDLRHRMQQPKADCLHSEEKPDKHTAARRKRQIKGWTRKKKLSLIHQQR